MKTKLIAITSILERSAFLHKGAAFIGGVFLFILLCLSTADVILRYVFARSITGVFEISGPLLVIIIFLVIGFPNLHQGHISIDVLLDKLSLKHRAAANIIITFFSLLMVSLLIWYSIAYGLSQWETHTRVAGWGIPILPILFLIPFGYMLLWLLLLRDFLRNLVKGLTLHFEGRLWLLSLAVVALTLIIIAFWVQPAFWNINRFTVGIIGTAIMVFLLLTGLPIAIAMMLADFIFLAHLYGVSGGYVFLGGWTFSILSNYTWTILAFFMLMGYVILHADFGKDLFHSAFKWFGRMPGGLALATVAGGAAFATVTGVAAATTIIGGAIAIPEMRKYKYDDLLSSGAICAAATLGPMIPPSVGFVVYGLITENSIGDLFVSGIVPGLMLTFAFMLYIYIKCRLDPQVAVRGPSARFSEKIVSLKYCWPVMLIFLTIVFGLFFGIFTPTEAGACGAATTFIIGAAFKRLNWNKLFSIFRDTGIMVGIMFFIIISAIIFGHFISVSQIPENVQRIVNELALSPIAVAVSLSFLYLILGCLLDPVAIIIITVPAFYDLVLGLGYDPIWFGVLVVLLTNLGMITPQVGMVCWGLKGTVPDLSLTKIFQGSVPFVWCTLFVWVLIIVFPQIATWLPNLLHR